MCVAFVLAGGGGLLAAHAATPANRQGNAFAEIGIAIGLFALVLGIVLGTALGISLLAYRRGSPAGRASLLCVEALLVTGLVAGVPALGIPVVGPSALVLCIAALLLAAW